MEFLSTFLSFDEKKMNEEEESKSLPPLTPSFRDSGNSDILRNDEIERIGLQLKMVNQKFESSRAEVKALRIRLAEVCSDLRASKQAEKAARASANLLLNTAGLQPLVPLPTVGMTTKELDQALGPTEDEKAEEERTNALVSKAVAAALDQERDRLKLEVAAEVRAEIAAEAEESSPSRLQTRAAEDEPPRSTTATEVAEDSEAAAAGASTVASSSGTSLAQADSASTPTPTTSSAVVEKHPASTLRISGPTLLDLQPDSPAFEHKLLAEEWNTRKLMTTLRETAAAAKEVSYFGRSYMEATARLGASMAALKLEESATPPSSSVGPQTETTTDPAPDDDWTAVVSTVSSGDAGASDDLQRLNTFLELCSQSLRERFAEQRTLLTVIEEEFGAKSERFIAEELEGIDARRSELDAARRAYSKDIEKYLVLRNKKAEEGEKKEIAVSQSRRKVEAARLELVTSLRRARARTPLIVGAQTAATAEALLASFYCGLDVGGDEVDDKEKCGVALRAHAKDLKSALTTREGCLGAAEEAWQARCTTLLGALDGNEQKQQPGNANKKKPPVKKRSFAKKNRDLAMTKGQARGSVIGSDNAMLVSSNIKLTGVAAIISRTTVVSMDDGGAGPLDPMALHVSRNRSSF